MEIIIYKEDGVFTNKPALKKFLDSIPDGRNKLTNQKSNKRTLQQNAWLHAILPDILQGLKEAGYNELRTTEDAKAVIKTLFFKKIVSNGFETIEVIEDTSKTSKEIFIERADQIIQWAKEYLGIDVAPPLKQIEIFDE